MKTQYLFISLLLILVASSCNRNISRSTSTTKSSNANINKSNLLVTNCFNYLGTPYKFGGEDKNGMDCSGLIFAAFQDAGKSLPRVSYKQADYFKEISKESMEIGDLVYFKVSSSRVNHTGMISKIINSQEIYFIHASTSKGVREDNLFSNYWYPKISKITRPN